MTDDNNVVPFSTGRKRVVPPRPHCPWPQAELDRLLAEEAYQLERLHIIRRVLEILRERKAE